MWYVFYKYGGCEYVSKYKSKRKAVDVASLIDNAVALSEKQLFRRVNVNRSCKESSRCGIYLFL